MDINVDIEIYIDRYIDRYMAFKPTETSRMKGNGGSAVLLSASTHAPGGWCDMPWGYGGTRSTRVTIYIERERKRERERGGRNGYRCR